MALRNFLKNDFQYLLFSEIYDRYNSPKKRRTAFSILEAAVDCFAKSGFERTTLQMIAKHAGQSRSSVHEYFNTIDEIRMTAIKYIRLLYQAYVLEEIQKETKPEEIFKVYFYCAFKWPRYFPKHSSVWISFMHLTTINPKFKGLNTASVEVGFSRLKEIVTMGVQTGAFSVSDVSSATRMIYLLINGLLLAQATESKPILERDEVTETFEFCCSILKMDTN